MFFQISPGAKPEKNVSKKSNDSEEVAVLSLAPFTPTPKIFFENVQVGKTAMRQLLIRNPTSHDIRLNVRENFPADIHIDFSWSSDVVPKGGELSLNLSWTPQCEGTWRPLLQLEDGSRIRKDIPIALKSMKPKTGKATAKSKVTCLPSYLKKRRSPASKSSRKVSPTKRSALPNITNIPNTVILPPESSSTFRIKENKENYGDKTNFYNEIFSNGNQNAIDITERRSTYTVKTLAAHNIIAANSDSNFIDSLESSITSQTENAPNTPHMHKDDLLAKLQSNSFLFSPVVTPVVNNFAPEHCSTEEKSVGETLSYQYKGTRLFPQTNTTFDISSKENSPQCALSTDTFVKGNTSTETYIKGNISTAETYIKDNLSAETFIKGNVSSSTFVRDSSVGDIAALELTPDLPKKSAEPRDSFSFRLESLSGNSMKNIIEANLWCENQNNRALSAIKEESFINASLINSTLKRKSNTTFNCSPKKRANITTTGIVDWSKKGGAPIRIARHTTGLSLKSFSESSDKMSTISKRDTSEVIVKNPFLLAGADSVCNLTASFVHCNEEWMDEQEQRFKKWLNALLTPPMELCANEEGHTVDIAKVWKECKKKEVAAAPTKEEISSKYHTNARLNSLRRNAQLLFRSKEISTVLMKVMIAINDNKLVVRSDRDIHLDLALKSEIMSIILSYNPLWLRIGLETIYNEIIPLNSNSDFMGLTSFIVERFFKHPYLLKKYKSVHSVKYNTEIKKFILKKFFALVYFLDQAKMRKLIGHDPCLFCKNAPVKESREALIRFSREALSSMGDITKYLKYFGYVVQHKQTYINEFNFAVNNLGVDLRDGVRLTRVMEIILMKNGLINNLRVPAISRLQKVHNMKIVFTSLAEADYEILYEISEKDIVDGHKEKTLTFLWQIIYRFQTPLMIKSATTIQTWWRSQPMVNKREQLNKIRVEREAAARKIQLWYTRQKLASKFQQLSTYARLFVDNNRKERAAVKIQSYIRMYLCRKKFLTLRSCIIIIQSYARKWLMCNVYNKRIKASIVIQSYFRMYRERKRFQKLKYYVHFIQIKFTANLLMKRDRERFENLRYAAIIIQRHFRNKKVGREIREKFLKIKRAAIVIQQQFRANKLRQIQCEYYQNLKYATIFIQRQYRAKLIMRRELANYNALKQATLVIQRRYRANLAMRQEMKNYQTLKKAALIIQMHYRAHSLMKKERDHYNSLRSAVITIQRRYRANKAMRVEVENYQALKKAALRIQQYYRGYRLMKTEKDNYQSLQRAALIIQRRYRANIAMRIEMKNYQALQNATLTIQMHYRAYKLMVKQRDYYESLRKAAVIIQRRFRANIAMRVQVKNYQTLRNATLKIQEYYRAYRLMKEEKTRYESLRRAVVIIQRRYRANKAMRVEMENYQALKKATLRIQQYYRGYRLMKTEKDNYQSLQRAALIIQRRYRANIARKIEMKNYQALQNATLTIQMHYRAYKLMIKQRDYYESLRKAAVIIQTRFRAKTAMRVQVKNYQTLRNATLKIQEYYRAYRLMKEEKTRYESLRRAVVIIQRRYRANKAMRVEVENYQALKKATLRIQQYYRGYRLMKAEEDNYKSLQRAALIIQRRYRANIAMRIEMKNYQTLKKAALTIQMHYRAYKLMIKDRYNYESLRRAAVVIQRRYRATRAMRIEMNNYQTVKIATLKIQRYYRAYKLMVKDRTHYELLRRSTLIIQRRYRANKTMKIQLENYQRLRNAAMKILTFYRSYKLMKKERDNYEALRRATLIIQRRFRANKAMKIEMKNYQTLKKAALTIQMHYRAYSLMRKERDYYNSLRRAAITIQIRYRAKKLMELEVEKYRILRNATVVIQRRFRANQLMKREMLTYQDLKNATLLIQRLYRAKRSMILQRSQYVREKCAVVTIQRWYRSVILCRKVRMEFVSVQRSVILIQRWYRNVTLTRTVRANFVEKVNAAKTIQKCYRKYRQSKIEKEILERKTKAVIIIQKYVRRYLVQKHFAPYFTPEAIQERRSELIRKSAVIKIQAAWRGYRSRSLDTPYLSELRSRLQSGNGNICPENTLAGRANKIFTFFYKDNLSYKEMETFLKDLDFLTRHSESICLKLGGLLSNYLYEVIVSSGRSLPEMNVRTLAALTLININRCPTTRKLSWRPCYLDGLITTMLHSCDKEAHLFPTICTLLWLFCHNDEYKETVLKIENLKQKIYKIEDLCSRKEKMVSKSNIKLSVFHSTDGLQVPSLTPDWGLNLKNKPRSFRNSIFALKSLKSILML